MSGSQIQENPISEKSVASRQNWYRGCNCETTHTYPVTVHFRGHLRNRFNKLSASLEFTNWQKKEIITPSHANEIRVVSIVSNIYMQEERRTVKRVGLFQLDSSPKASWERWLCSSHLNDVVLPVVARSHWSRQQEVQRAWGIKKPCFPHIVVSVLQKGTAQCHGNDATQSNTGSCAIAQTTPGHTSGRVSPAHSLFFQCIGNCSLSRSCYFGWVERLWKVSYLFGGLFKSNVNLLLSVAVLWVMQLNHCITIHNS